MTGKADPAGFRLAGLPGVTVALKRSDRARRMSLRVSRIDGRVTLTAPLRARAADAVAFAEAQIDWLRRALARTPIARRPAFGETLPFEGRLLTITPAPLRAPIVEGDRLLIGGAADTLARRLEAFLRDRARIGLGQATARYAAQVGRPVRRITLRDTRSRWGSCAQDGSISYSWRLIMAPPSALDYVAAHEVAHLVEMNHSAAFWAVVARLRPDYAADRAWLKREGGALHAIRFRE